MGRGQGVIGNLDLSVPLLSALTSYRPCWRFATRAKIAPNLDAPVHACAPSANHNPLFCYQMASAPTSAASQQLTAWPAPRIDSVLFAFYVTLSELIRYNVHPRFCPSKNGRPSNLAPFPSHQNRSPLVRLRVFYL